MKLTVNVWDIQIWELIFPMKKHKAILDGQAPQHFDEVRGHVKDANSFFAEIMPGGTIYQCGRDSQKSAYDLMSECMRELGFPWKTDDCTVVKNDKQVVLINQLEQKAFVMWPDENTWALHGVRAWYRDKLPVYKIFQYSEGSEPGEVWFKYDWSC